MNKNLKTIYYDPKHPASYSGLDKLYRHVKHMGYKKPEVKKWLEKQDVYTLHKPVSRQVKRPRIVVSAVDQQWDLDTMHMVKFNKHNKGYSYVLVAIDIFTRFAWTVALKTVTGREMVTALASIFTEFKPEKIRTDSGTEFKNRSVKAFLISENVFHFTSTNELKANIAERCIKSLKMKIKKIMHERGSDVWLDILQQVTESYNNSKHRSIQMTPSEARNAEQYTLWNNQYVKKLKNFTSHAPTQQEIFKYHVNDKVRLAKFRATFERAYSEKWTDEIFIVTKRESLQGIAQYTIKSWDNDPVIGKFYTEELERIEVNEGGSYEIEKLIQKKNMEKKPGYIVKWDGWPNQFNSWVSLSEVQKSGLLK